MKFHIEQAGLWLKTNTASRLKPDMPQAVISKRNPQTLHYFVENKWPISS